MDRWFEEGLRDGFGLAEEDIVRLGGQEPVVIWVDNTGSGPALQRTGELEDVGALRTGDMVQGRGSCEVSAANS